MAGSNGGTVKFKVESQLPRVAPGPDGRPVDGVEVHFVTDLGNRSSVFVPRSDYTVDRVKEALRAHAAEMDAVSGLSQA